MAREIENPFEDKPVKTQEVTAQWSSYQQAIFDFIESGAGSAVVIAVAGSGKTTTIVEAANRIPKNQSCSFVAFNKSIASELSERLPSHVRSQTLNSMGFGAWRKHVNTNLKVDKFKTQDLMNKILSPLQMGQYASVIPKLVGLAKSVGIVPKNHSSLTCLTRDTDENWMELMDRQGLEFSGGDIFEGINLARQVLNSSISVGDAIIDFDDQMYLPVIHNAKFWQNDWLFVDEAQDVNMVQRAMLRRALRPNGRLVAVGDPFQAIYGFRGADIDSIPNIKNEFNAGELPLSISYRCPQLIVKEAQRFVPHILHADTAPLGEVIRKDREFIYPTEFGQSDAILCRNAAPLVKTAFHLLRNRVPCKMKGRDIGQGLVTLIKKMRAKDPDDLEKKLSSFAERECAKFNAKGREEMADSLMDKVDTVRVFIETLPEDDRTIGKLIEEIESLFTDDARGILLLSTVHKAKGLEWSKVFILDSWRMPSKFARQAWQLEQERNIQYVAVTRSKSQLVYINSDRLRDAK